MSETRLPIVLSALASLVLAVSVAWWWLVFSTVISNGYVTHRQAIVCMAAETDLCRLAQALCTQTHVFELRWYAPESLWIAAALLVSAAVQSMLGTRPR
ncbi:hypothetical protein [Rhizobium sp. SGZ-381]|uniref:hypothetical protein n=1 Tax=Rhizobium sp. SGZ-381 TaxID=3342800 RepID=UPI0036704169